MAGTHPEAAEELDVNETDDGVIIYDAVTDKVHYLNTTAALILQLCDGSRDTPTIAAFLAEGFGLEEPPLEETEACLAQLAEEGLVR